MGSTLEPRSRKRFLRTAVTLLKFRLVSIRFASGAFVSNRKMSALPNSRQRIESLLNVILITDRPDPQTEDVREWNARTSVRRFTIIFAGPTRPSIGKLFRLKRKPRSWPNRSRKRPRATSSSSGMMNASGARRLGRSPNPSVDTAGRVPRQLHSRPQGATGEPSVVTQGG